MQSYAKKEDAPNIFPSFRGRAGRVCKSGLPLQIPAPDGFLAAGVFP
jgi:hypothetical protein